MNTDFNKIITTICQKESLGKKFYETLDKDSANYEAANSIINDFAKRILPTKETNFLLQPEKKQEFDDLQREWKLIKLTPETIINSKVQDEISNFFKKAQKTLNLQENKNQQVNLNPNVKLSKEEKEPSQYPEIDDLPPLITSRADFSDHLDIETLDPYRLWKWADYLKTHPPLFSPNAAKPMQDAGKQLLWIQECFPELTKSTRFQEAFKGLTESKAVPINFTVGINDVAKIRMPLSEKHTKLCIGTGTTDENSRQHDIETSYTINLDGLGNPHVSDNIMLLPSRNYLNDADQKPHQFEEIYVEVSCKCTDFINPQFMEFMNAHLKPGGKLYLEMSFNLLNTTIDKVSEMPNLEKKGISYRFNPKYQLPENPYITSSDIDKITYKETDKNVSISVQFKGDWKNFFSRFAFEKVQLSNKPAVQLFSTTVEMTKKM